MKLSDILLTCAAGAGMLGSVWLLGGYGVLLSFAALGVIVNIEQTDED
jgi:hypothetical protein